MTKRGASLAAGVLVLASAALIAAGQDSGATAKPTPSLASQGGRAGDRYKNVQVLQDISYSELNGTMHLIRTSCQATYDYCHDVEHYEADTKPTKVTARRM